LRKTTNKYGTSSTGSASWGTGDSGTGSAATPAQVIPFNRGQPSPPHVVGQVPQG